MTKKQEEIKEGEKVVEEWLQQIEAEDIRYCGGKGEDGPPDFVMRHFGKEIAVEATRLPDIDGWRKKQAIAFCKAAKKLYAEISKEGANWHVEIECDERQPFSDMKDGYWQKKLVDALRTGKKGDEFQLVAKEKVQGDGVVLRLLALASDEGGFNFHCVNIGGHPALELNERIFEVVEKKTKQVLSAINRGSRAQKYDCWWLVFDDETLIVPKDNLGHEEMTDVEKKIRKIPGRKQWDKIILVSKLPVELSDKSWTLWNHPDSEITLGSS